MRNAACGRVLRGFHIWVHVGDMRQQSGQENSQAGALALCELDVIKGYTPRSVLLIHFATPQLGVILYYQAGVVQ